MDLMLIKLVLTITISGCGSQLVNRPPAFDPSPSSFDVTENERGRILTTLQAIDPDGDPIAFSIDIDDYFNITRVNSTTVNVISTRGIDYEQNTNVEFIVTATDQTSNSRTTKQISVNVRDRNDNGPLFAQGGSSSFVIAENEPVGYRITEAFRVTDADTGRNAETEITCFVDPTTSESRRACETFRLEATRVSNGNYAVDIIVAKTLDFETIRSYILAVKATNAEPPANFTTKNFVINILDSQDQLPEFLRAPYSPIPLEEIPVGSVIDVISVRDGDREARPARNLQLQLLNDTRDWLNLSPLINSSGTFTSNLTVKNRMDREQYHNSPVYTVAVQVSELFPDGSVDTSAVTTSYIRVQIFDINDNAPEFFTGTNYQEKIIAPLALDIDEGLGVNTNLPGFLVSVVDIDIPPNNQFDIRMEGFGNDTFQLSPRFGTGSAVLSLAVKKEANLDYEKEQYRHMELTIIAADRSGDVNLTRTAIVIINLIDKNDNYPHFLQGVYTTRVSPDVNPGSPIVTVNATDADSGEFGRTTYSITQPSDLVRIDRDTGVVYLVAHPREGSSTTRYEVELEVTDGGGKSTTARLVVNFRSEFPEQPRFESHIYNATVYENRTNFNNEPVRVRAIRLTEEAVDMDSSVITYAITGGNTPDQAFQLQETSGQLTLRRPLLKRDGRQFDLEVQASDGQLTDTARIVIDLLDYNDYTPQFAMENYARVIQESTAIGTVILNISASDEDGTDEEGGHISYYILSGDTTQRFYINADTGELTVNAALDFDTQRFYILQVRAEDNGVPRKSAIVIVNITLTDINNRLPRFTNDLYIQYMNEEDPVGSRVLQVNAFDVDRGSTLRYSIVANSYIANDPYSRDVIASPNYDFRNGFTIDERTGVITTLLPFDREAVSFVSFKVRVVDINGEVPRTQQGFADVEVNIREEGVGVPIFLNEPWTAEDQRIVINITEGSSGLILNLLAVNSITLRRITRFREVAGDPDNFFTVHVNGEVHLNRPLDYEELLSRTKRIIVDAVTSTGEASTATLEVNVININDNSPQFSQNEYSFSLAEGVYTTRKWLGSVVVTDRDGDVNFIYRLTGRYANIFQIDNQGVIYLNSNTTIDVESVDRYDILVEVTDRDVSGRTSVVPVTIRVSNTNEHYPVCAQSLFSFFVPKSISIDQSFGRVFATDQDAGDVVRYFIDNDATFAVDQTSGVISAAVRLSSSEQASYEFGVRVRDSTLPYREAICRVNVIVTAPERSNRPIFTIPSTEGDTYSIREESEYNTTVVVIKVRNPDSTPVYDVMYTLSDLRDTRYFNIDPYTGRVYVVEPPDREVQQQYELIVVARTNRTEVSRKFYVSLTDIDDNNPKFSSCGNLSYPYVLEVVEEQAGGRRVIGAIKACDKDGPPHSTTYYHIVTCSNGSTTSQPERQFSINIETGEISVDPRGLDRESAASHTLCVNASTSRTNTSVRSEEWKVVIRVIDIDDHKLQFVQSVVSVVISGNIGTGQEVVRIQASDRDLSLTDDITYSIVSIEYIRGTEVIKGSNNATIRAAFSIDRNTGKITTNLPSYINLIGGRFEVKITANSLTDSATLNLTVFINSPSEQLVLVIDQPPDEVNKSIQEFFQELEEIHGYKFVVQKITYHQDPNTQQTDLNMTDVYMYVLDKDGNLVNSSRVAEILQRGYDSRQAALFTKYGVVDGDPRTSPQVTITDNSSFTDWYFYEWIWWIIIASAIMLVIDALILICCLFCLYDKYVKRPRTEQAPATVYLR